MENGSPTPAGTNPSSSDYVASSSAARNSHKSLTSSLCRGMFAPVDIIWLAWFRIAFGTALLWEVGYEFSQDWFRVFWTEGLFHFTYYGFEWVRPWSGIGMEVHIWVLRVLAVFIVIGLWYRVSICLFFLGFTYVFLLEQALYLNHFYLICLVSFLMIFVPAHRAFSIDAWRKSSLSRLTVPVWTLWLLRAQIAIPYIYGGIAKLDGDWLRCAPMRMLLASRNNHPIIGRFVEQDWMVYLFTYGGLLFDLLVIPFLLWRKTRTGAFAVAVAFHLTNAWLFDIGVFPWLMIAATAILFAPDWPRRLAERVGNTFKWRRVPASACASEGAVPPRLDYRKALLLAFLAVYLAIQILVPLRHLLYPGNVAWTEEGHRFSWRMMLRVKQAQGRFRVVDASGTRFWEVDADSFLIERQAREMWRRPDMILQFSHHLAEQMQGAGHGQVQVRAEVMASLNGRRPQMLVDPNVNLAAEPRRLTHAEWILPMKEPLP